jgi:hypothetical protein
MDHHKMNIRKSRLKRYELHSNGSGQDPVAGFGEHSDEPLG